MKARGTRRWSKGEPERGLKAGRGIPTELRAKWISARWGHLALPSAAKIIAAFAFVFGVLCSAGCHNMKDQRNYRPLDPSPLFPDGASARHPPAHTVAHEEHPANELFLTGYQNGNPVTTLPMPITAALLQRGQERFNIFCAVCHGEDGYGRGIVVRRGFPSPPSYHDDRLRQAPFGHIFEVITRGYGTMYSLADRVTPADRWAITAYIRVLQRSQAATLADVPPDALARLNSSVP